jgi:SAM-dependent methyltransferase
MQRQENWFQGWFNSPYYHKLYAYRDDKEAAGFIEALMARLNPPPGSRMLDVACGRGRHAKILAAKGFDVTGIDLAPANIAFAIHSQNDHLHFYEQDMRRLSWINYFDYAFNFFTSFGYFKTDREHLLAIRNISQSLRPEGIFVIDYLNAGYVEDHLVKESVKKKGDSSFLISKWSDKTHFYKKINIREPGLSERIEFTEKVARFTLDDFEKMFTANALRISEVFGDYALNPYDKKQSPRLVIIAKKGNRNPFQNP